MPLFRPSEFLTPQDINDVPALLKQYGKNARIIAGGTGFYELARRGMIPEVQKIISLQKVGLNYVRIDDKNISIGSTTVLADLVKAEFVQDARYGAIKDALNEIRPTQVRNVATVGGEVSLALPLVDLPVALLALNAEVVVLGSRGQRVISLDEFYLDFFLTDLKKDELVTEIRIPRTTGRTGSAFYKIGRSTYDFALVSSGVLLTLDEEGRVESSRIIVGGVSRVPMRAEKVERRIRGKKIGENRDFLESAVQILREIKPLASIHGSSEYKREIVKVLVRDLLVTAAKRGAQVE